MEININPPTFPTFPSNENIISDKKDLLSSVDSPNTTVKKTEAVTQEILSRLSKISYETLTYNLMQAEKREKGSQVEIDDIAFGIIWDFHPINPISLKDLTKDITPEEIDQFVLQLQTSSTHFLSWASQDKLDLYPKYALAAYEKQKISVQQFASICMNWASMKDFQLLKNGNPPIEFYPLFDEKGNPTTVMKNYLMKNFNQNEDQVNTFFALMRHTPVSEQVCSRFVLKDVSEDSIYDGLLQANFRIFMPEGEEQPDGTSRLKIVVPSFSMLQNYLIARFGSNAVLPWPVLGLSSPLDIEKDIEHQRHQFGLNFPGLNPNIIADAFQAGLYGWSLHDFFHCYIASFVPYTHRLAFGDIVTLLKERLALEKEDLTPQELNDIHDVIEEFIDMQHGEYYPGYQENSQESLKLDTSEMVTVLNKAFLTAVNKTAEPLIYIGQPSYFTTILQAMQNPAWEAKFSILKSLEKPKS